MKDFEYLARFNTTKTSKLTLNSVLAYSLLAGFDRLGKACSKRYMKDYLGMSTGLATALDRLIEVGLAKPSGNRFRASQPDESTSAWFLAGRPSNEHWSRSYLSHQWFRPSDSCPLSTTTLSVLWLVRDQARQGRLVSYNGLAVMAGVSKRSVERAVADLCAKDFIKKYTTSVSGRYEMSPGKDVPAAWLVPCKASQQAAKDEADSADKPKWLRAIAADASEVEVERAKRIAIDLVATRFYAWDYVCELNPMGYHTGLLRENVHAALLDDVEFAVEHQAEQYKRWYPLFEALAEERLSIARRGCVPGDTTKIRERVQIMSGRPKDMPAQHKNDVLFER